MFYDKRFPYSINYKLREYLDPINILFALRLFLTDIIVKRNFIQGKFSKLVNHPVLPKAKNSHGVLCTRFTHPPPPINTASSFPSALFRYISIFSVISCVVYKFRSTGPNVGVYCSLKDPSRTMYRVI